MFTTAPSIHMNHLCISMSSSEAARNNLDVAVAAYSHCKSNIVEKSLIATKRDIGGMGLKKQFWVRAIYEQEIEISRIKFIFPLTVQNVFIKFHSSIRVIFIRQCKCKRMEYARVLVHALIHVVMSFTHNSARYSIPAQVIRVKRRSINLTG